MNVSSLSRHPSRCLNKDGPVLLKRKANEGIVRGRTAISMSSNKYLEELQLHIN